MEDLILFLGTGAADWGSPAPDGEHRRFSSVLLNHALLIDPGPGVTDYAAGGALDSVSDVLITHSHSDHLSAETVSALRRDNKEIRVYANGAVRQQIPPMSGVRFQPLSPFVTEAIGRHLVTPLPANHSTKIPGETPYHYIVTTATGKTAFYGCDGAWLLNSTWLKMLSYQFDLMVFDCTVGEIEGDYRIFEHNSIAMVKHMKQTVQTTGMLSENGKFVVSHLAKTLHLSHQKTERLLWEHGIITAYDGLILPF